ncbi:MAG: TrmH family RNA methyltransferase [Treponema sp.]|jgi:TrmH family RNA methyltransferase|nr:TrmH family RNA methyltransferase [Treponema sp.]
MDCGKLTRLPRSQRLRKAEKILAVAERRFLAAEREAEASAGTVPGRNREELRLFPAAELIYLRDLLEMLGEDGDFSLEERRVLRQGRDTLASASNVPGALGGVSRDTALRRALNSARHIILAATGRYPADWDFTDPHGRLDPAKRRPFPGMAVYLEDIRSPFNVGAIFRSAEFFGAEKLWLSPLCADPRHHRAERTAMGCTDVLPWERLDEDPFPKNPAVPGLGSVSGVFALETGGIDIGKFPFPKAGVMIVGSEELGVSPAALAGADASLGRVSIPGYGAKASLNVSAAFAIVMQKWAERIKAERRLSLPLAVP